MTYEDHVKYVFIEHHDCMGMDEEEIIDLLVDTPFVDIEKWLTKIGYDLNEYYLLG